MKARACVALAAAALLGIGLTGCASNDAPSAGASDTGVIKIANIMTSSGALAENAATIRQTWQYAVDEANKGGGAGGYTFQLITADTDASPAASVRAASQAVSQDGATIFASFQTSPENAAINPQLASWGALSINTVGQDDGLRAASCSADSFNTVQSNTMLFNSLAGQIANIDGEKWAIMAVDYSVGHGGAEAFKKAAEAHGKKIVSEQFAPLNTTDYGSYITKIQRSGADGLLLIMYGPDAEAFVNQAAQYKLSDQVKTTLTLNVITEQSFQTLGDKILDDYLVKQFDPTAKDASTFVEGYTDKFGVAPNDYAANAYLGAQALFAAVAKAKSDDVTKIRDALSGMSFDSIMGQVTIRPEDHQALTPIYLAQVVKGDSGLEFKVLSSTDGADSAGAPSPDCKL